MVEFVTKENNDLVSVTLEQGTGDVDIMINDIMVAFLCGSTGMLTMSFLTDTESKKLEEIGIPTRVDENGSIYLVVDS